jgi:hypothetical protein
MAKTVGPVAYGIFVNEQLIKNFALDIELRQGWGQHDLFFVRIEYYRGLNLSNIKLWPDNAPVRIIWGQTPGNTQTWYGYVNHHTIDANSDSGSKAMQVTYTCIGTSKPMNTDKTRRWGQVTGTYMAKTIAAEYGLRVVLSSTNWILPSEVQANESDFKFLNRMADKTGYRFWVSGGTLYFVDPSVVLQGGLNQNVPSFYMDKSFLYLDTIRDFHMLRGDNIPGAAQTTRTIYGIDGQSGSVFSAVASNPGTVSSGVIQIFSEWPVSSQHEAQQLVNAYQSRSQFWQAATAELYGTSLIYPGKLIQLTGNQLNTEAAGYWIVASSDHVMRSSGTSDPTKDMYVTHAELLKNTSVTLPVIKNITKIIPEFVPCSLYKGVWRATRQTTIYDNPPGQQ